MTRIRDFDDPAEEDYERVMGEQRDREERDDQAGRDEPWPTTAECRHVPRFTADTPEGAYECTYCGVLMRPVVLSRPQED